MKHFNLKTYITTHYNVRALVYYALIGFAFFYILAHGYKFGDDVGAMHVEGGISDYWEKSVYYYNHWSSRIFVNFVVLFLTDNPFKLWALLMGGSMFLMLLSLHELCGAKSNIAPMLIVSIVLLYPYEQMSVVGWIATATTYFVPMAFTMAALVPIKWIWEGRKIYPAEFIVFVVCMLYGGNSEQNTIILIGLYVLSFVLFLVTKKTNIYHVLLMVLSFVNLYIIYRAPGNLERYEVETRFNNPEYGMLQFSDKLENGYTWTMGFLYYENNYFVPVIALLLFLCVLLRYKNIFLRLLAFVPAAVTVLGAANRLLHLGIPFLPSDYAFGFVHPLRIWDTSVFWQFMLISVVTVLLAIEIVILSKSYFTMGAALCMILLGMTSRMAIMFSPTLYISGLRTCLPFSFCLMVASLLVIFENLDGDVLDKRLNNILSGSAAALTLAGVYLLNGLV